MLEKRHSSVFTLVAAFIELNDALGIATVRAAYFVYWASECEVLTHQRCPHPRHMRRRILQSNVKKRKTLDNKGSAVKRVMGIEPTPPAWEAGVLPLNYTRMTCCNEHYRTKCDKKSSDS
jgi:hypothetical protein